jgi:hypothetical protein
MRQGKVNQKSLWTPGHQINSATGTAHIIAFFFPLQALNQHLCGRQTRQPHILSELAFATFVVQSPTAGPEKHSRARWNQKKAVKPLISC